MSGCSNVWSAARHSGRRHTLNCTWTLTCLWRTRSVGSAGSASPAPSRASNMSCSTPSSIRFLVLTVIRWLPFPPYFHEINNNHINSVALMWTGLYWHILSWNCNLRSLLSLFLHLSFPEKCMRDVQKVSFFFFSRKTNNALLVTSVPGYLFGGIKK